MRPEPTNPPLHVAWDLIKAQTNLAKSAMNLKPDTLPDEDDMPVDIDFSKGVHGKFYKPGMRIVLPVHLEQQVQDTLVNLARAKGVDYNVLINDLWNRRQLVLACRD